MGAMRVLKRGEGKKGVKTGRKDGGEQRGVKK